VNEIDCNLNYLILNQEMRSLMA